MTRDWQVLIPMKRLDSAKTRIDADPATRANLALAMCKDVVAAVIDSPRVARVHVITADRRVANEVRVIGARAWCIPGTRGLNMELAAATMNVRTRHGVAAVMADLPCLTTGLFTEIIDAASTQRATFLTDATGRGTTMLLNPPSVRATPRFGGGSAIAHGAFATPLPVKGSWLPAQHDVDTVEDLASAARLGLGAFTRSLSPLRVLPAARETVRNSRLWVANPLVSRWA